MSYRGAALPDPSFRSAEGETHTGAEMKRVWGFFHTQIKTFSSSSIVHLFRTFKCSFNSEQPISSLKSFSSFPPSSPCFFLHTSISDASCGHQTAEMGAAVTLLSAPGNPTLRQRHNARQGSATTPHRIIILGNSATFGKAFTLTFTLLLQQT